MSLRRSIAWAFTGQTINFAVGFASSVVLARLLTPREMGVYAVALATMGVIQIVANFGISSYVLREKELGEDLLSAAFTANVILSVVLSTIIFVVSFYAEWLLDEPAAGSVLRLLAVGPLLGIPAFRPATLLQREMRYRAIAFIGSIAVVVGAVTMVGSAVAGLSSWSPAIGGLAGNLTSVIGYVVVGRSHVSYRFSLEGWRAMTRFGVRMMSIGGVSALVNRLTEIVLGHLLGLTALGLYTRASNLGNMIFENLYGTATRVVFVQLSKDFHERGDLRTTFVRSLRMITATMWPALIGLAVLSRPVIYLIYGPRWLEAALPLSVLLTAQVFTLCYGMNWELFVLRDETARQTRLEVARSLFWLVAFTIGCQFGLLGAAIGTAITAFSGIFFYFRHVVRLARVGSGELVGVYAQSAVLTAVAAAPAALLMAANDWSERTPPVLVAAAIVAGVAAWFAALVVTGHPLLAELRVIARRVPGLRRFAGPSEA